MELQPENTIICDVDEVVLHFLGPFRTFLQERGLQLESRDYSLNNNIVDRKTGILVEREMVGHLIQEFYSKEATELPMVEHAKDRLLELSEVAQIFLLTNIPNQFQDQRKQNLGNIGLNYPLVFNQGLKGPAAAKLVERTEGQVFFLDDIPSNLISVGEYIKNVHLVHFVADLTFFDVAPDTDGVKLKTRSWNEVAKYVKMHI